MRGIGYHVVHAFSARCQVRVERARRAPRATAAEAHTTVPQPWPWPPIIMFSFCSYHQFPAMYQVQYNSYTVHMKETVFC